MTVDVEAVVFDVGETLVDETRIWEGWADHLGVTRLTFLAALGGVIERGGDHREVFELVRPGFDPDAASEADRGRFDADDLYPDVRPALAALRAAGYRLGIAGNQPPEAQATLESLALDVDVIATSASWAVEKPDPAFFARVAETVGCPPERVAYVGDRLDNDVGPARAAGMVAVWLRRGPWALLQGSRPGAPAPDVVVDSLTDLTTALAQGRQE